MKRFCRPCLVVLIAGAVLTLALFFGLRKALLGPFHEKVEADVSVRTRLIQEYLGKSLLAAKAVQEKMHTGNPFDETGFRHMASSFLREETGLDSIVWIAQVSRKDRRLFEEKARRLVRPDFRITELDPQGRLVTAGDRDFYYPILFVEDHDAASILSIGFDTASDLRRAAALERARETGSPSITKLVALPTRQDATGVVAYFPAYAGEKTAGTPDERRAATKGFVGAVFHPDRLIKAALSLTRPIGIPFDLWDVSDPSEKHFIYHWAARLQRVPVTRSFLYSPPPTFARRFTAADREWEVRATPNIGYLEQNHPTGHWLVLVFGSVLTLLLAFYFQKEFSRREHLSTLNKSLETEIDERKRAEISLKKLLEELQTALANVKTLEGILPICASCKKIRDDKGYWTQVEAYVSRHTTAEFSHGICPDCAKKLYLDFTRKNTGSSQPPSSADDLNRQ